MIVLVVADLVGDVVSRREANEKGALEQRRATHHLTIYEYIMTKKLSAHVLVLNSPLHCNNRHGGIRLITSGHVAISSPNPLAKEVYDIY